MKVQELRKEFIEFFKNKGHTVVPSAGLIPTGDPTLLFTSAGMVQFKKLYSGEVTLPYRRAVSCQKCLRASDLDKVGRSAKYVTFFEMLGNFSFGDYFKQEAIEWAWEFVTKVVKLPLDALYMSVLDEDEEAYRIWRNGIRLDESKIYRLSKEHNFWGPTGGRGACGSCSEIYYDFGRDVGCGKSDCKPGCDCDRFIEIWNLVFPQYDAQADSTLKLLKNRGIDTGLGLERFTTALQGKKSLFELEIFTPIIEETQKIFGVNSMRDEKLKSCLYIIADHIRALTFAVAEGVYPSNIGRGYLLRHLLRRAQAQAYELGIRMPFLYKLVPLVVDVMRDQYPELVERREGITLVVKSEEESFLKTLYKGTEVFNQITSTLKYKEIPGDAIFKLYDTYGFPPDLTYELAKSKGFESDKVGFEKLMEFQKEQARRASKFEATKVEWNEIFTYKEHVTQFMGYKELECSAKIIRWRKIGDKSFEVVLNKSPFYSAAGGQVNDTGKIKIKSEKLKEIEIVDTQKEGDFIINTCKVSIPDWEPVITNYRLLVKCMVDKSRRRAIERNHTGTHLLHSALRQVLGNWVHQEGSLVERERFRFDFTHFKPLEQYEIEKVENLINSWILENMKVKTYITSFEVAVKQGAMAIFGEKYGEKVRVVRIGDISIELCGGTHVKTTGEIGVLKIISETGVHAGIRRVEVITGDYAIQWLKRQEQELISVSEKLGVAPSKVRQKVDELVESESKLRSRLAQLEHSQILGMVPEILSKKQTIKEIDILVSQVPATDVNVMRVLADKLREGERRVGVVGSVINDKPIFVTFVSDDLKNTIKASDLAKEIGKLAGGGGGGRDTLGEAGGKDSSKLRAVMDKLPELISNL